MQRLVNASMLNQYLYCPRRFWYIIYQDTQGNNYYKTDGKSKHENQSTRGGWTREIYVESTELGLKGKVDVFEDREGVPVERKRGEDYYPNDEIQLTAYCLLLEEAMDEVVDEGVIYLFGTDRRHKIRITEWHRNKLQEVLAEIREMDVTTPPPFTDNPAKCEKCSTREYCLPAETAKLEPDKVRGSGWEDEI